VGVAADPTGKYVFVVNQGDPSVTTYQVQSDGSVFQISNTGPTGLNTPTAIAVDATGSFVYVTNGVTNNIAQYQNFNGFLSPVTPNVAAGTLPTAIKTTYFIN